MSEAQQTAGEVFDSLTGFDEMAIVQHFDRAIGDMADQDASMFHRALIFVVKRREGANDDDARNAALGLTMKEHMAFFTPDEQESGKDEQLDEQPEAQPEASLSSVS